MNHSVHLEIDDDKVTKVNLIMALNSEGDDNFDLCNEDDDRSLLIVNKPNSNKQLEHVYFFNFLALMFLLTNVTLNLIVLAIIHDRVPMDQPHLPDITFDVLPDNRKLFDVTEYFIVFQMTGLFFLLFFHKHRSIIFRRICIIMGVIYFFRTLCMASPQLPLASRNYYCSPQLKNSHETANISLVEFIKIIASRVFYMSIGMGLSINGHHAYCGDYIFSGHTAILVFIYLMFQEYLMPTRKQTLFWKIFEQFQYLMTIISVICIIIARGHYLFDILLAYYFVSRTFYIYHSLCNNSTNYYSRFWWWPVFEYFESVRSPSTLCKTKGESVKFNLNRVHRIFEWPLPWPKRFVQQTYRTQLA